MKRNLIAIVAAALALGATAVKADNDYIFADSFWKQETTQFRAVTQEVQAGEYDLVDNYAN